MPTFYAGQRLTAATLQAAIGLNASKGADLPRATNTTLAADPDLTLTVAANSAYLVTLLLLYKGGTTGSSDFKFGWSLPAGATLTGDFTGISNPIGLISFVFTAAAPVVSYTNGTGNSFPITIEATLVTAGAAGTFALTWAQNTSNATATTLEAGSNMRAQLR